MRIAIGCDDTGLALKEPLVAALEADGHDVLDLGTFSTDIASQQRELMRRSYEAVRTLRLTLANHPAAKSVKVDDLLYEGRIWTK